MRVFLTAIEINVCILMIMLKWHTFILIIFIITLKTSTAKKASLLERHDERHFATTSIGCP